MATRSEREGRDALNRHHQAVFAQLMLDPTNQYCADCRLKDPRWASWNLGIFVCIDCSGIHRSIGTHISKVKSVNLDTWTTEQVENMVAWGNQRANAYWEQSLPSNFKPDRSNMNNFIRAKYERKEFAKGPVPKQARAEMPQPSSSPSLSSQRSSPVDESRSQPEKRGKTKEDLDSEKEKRAIDREAKLRAARRAQKGDRAPAAVETREETPEQEQTEISETQKQLEPVRSEEEALADLIGGFDAPVSQSPSPKPPQETKKDSASSSLDELTELFMAAPVAEKPQSLAPQSGSTGGSGSQKASTSAILSLYQQQPSAASGQSGTEQTIPSRPPPGNATFSSAFVSSSSPSPVAKAAFSGRSMSQ